MTATLAQPPPAEAATGYVVGEYLLDRLDVPPLLAQIAREARRANTAVREP